MDGSTVCGVVEEVIKDENYISPIIANFEYGTNCVTNGGTADIESKMVIDPETSKKKLVILLENQELVGDISTGAESLSQTLLLIRNKKSNKIRIVPAWTATLKDIGNQKLSESWSMADGDVSSQKTGKEKLKHLKNLAFSFGSKKSKRSTELSLRLIDTRDNKEEKMKESISQIDVKLSDVEKMEETTDELLKLLPPCDREATKPEDVYSADTILSKAERDSLKVFAEDVIKNSLDTKKASGFLCTFYPLLGAKPDLEKVILLLYTDSLIKFFKIQATKLRNKSILQSICPYSRLVSQRVLNDFTVQVGNHRTRPNYCKDKLVCYLLLSLLLVFDYKIPLDKISSFLHGFSQKKLGLLTKLVGIVPAGLGKSDYILKIPLPSLPSSSKRPFSRK